MDFLEWLESEEIAKKPLETTTTTEVLDTKAVKLEPTSKQGTTFEINKDVLAYLIEKASVALPKSSTVAPILENFQFKVEEGKLTVIASNMEMAVSISTSNVDTINPGIEIFPAKKLLAIVREADNGKVFAEVTSQGAAWVIGNASWELQQPKSKDYPRLDSIDGVDFQAVDREQFIEAVSKVKYAVAKDQFRSQLRMINVKGGRFTGFDGLRFQMYKILDFNRNLHIPTFGIDTLLKMLRSSSQETLYVGETKNKIVFKLSNEMLYMSKLTAQYPNVETLVLRPALTNDVPLSVDKEALRKAIKRVRIVADTDSNAIGLNLSKNSLEVIAKDINGDKAVEKIEAVYSGKKRTMVVSHHHLQDLIRNYTPDTCTFLLGEDSKNKRSTLLLKDVDTGAIGFISQLHSAVLK